MFSGWITPPKFNSSPLKNGDWKTILSHRDPVTFQGRAVELREGSHVEIKFSNIIPGTLQGTITYPTEREVRNIID